MVQRAPDLTEILCYVTTELEDHLVFRWSLQYTFGTSLVTFSRGLLLLSFLRTCGASKDQISRARVEKPKMFFHMQLFGIFGLI